MACCPLARSRPLTDDGTFRKAPDPVHSETKYQDSAQKYSRLLGMLSTNHFVSTGKKIKDEQ